MDKCYNISIVRAEALLRTKTLSRELTEYYYARTSA